MTRHDFATRLRLARAMIARGLPPAPVHVADQVAAAGAEAREHHDRLAMVLPLLEPGRNWRHRLASSPSDEIRAYLLAGVLGCTAYCVHLRRGGPQPAYIRLPLRRADCGRCVQTLRRSVTGANECDLCGADGVVTFHPFAVRHGPALIAGDVCGGCADVLGIAVEKVGA
jgi:hypothetical protein